MIPKMEYKEEWCFDLEGKIFVSIKHWGVQRGEFKSLNNGKRVWNYYISIPERILGTQAFEPFWLEDKKTKFSEAGAEYITHDYMQMPLNVASWHGGMTYYEKIGCIINHRVIKLGCDYSHVWDEERGYDYTLEDIVSDALTTAQELKKLLNL